MPKRSNPEVRLEEQQWGGGNMLGVAGRLLGVADSQVGILWKVGE